jgi:hypothetical protein
MIKGPYDFVNKEQHAKNVRIEEEEEDLDGSIPPETSIGRRISTVRPQARDIEETDTDYEWHSSDSEV